MTIKHELRSCPGCGGLVSVPVKRPNHILHAVLSIITCGVWLVVWALAGLEALASRPKVQKHCMVCRPKMKWWEKLDG